MIKLPETREQWREFMNGYRDPIGRAEDRKRDEDAGFFRDDLGGGSGGAGERECGHRKEGGTYAVCPSSPFGKPVEHFVLCKPIPVDPEEYNLANVGVKLVDVDEECLACKVAPGEKPKYKKKGIQCPVCAGTQKETVTHVFDIVGREFYPNVADFIEEVRRMGLSRRLELETSGNYARLSKRSRLFLLHARAVIGKPYEIYKHMGGLEKIRIDRAGCPKALPIHKLDLSRLLLHGKMLDAPGCSSLYWNVIQDGEFIAEAEDAEFINDPCPDCQGVGAIMDENPPHSTTNPGMYNCGTCKTLGTLKPRFVERKLASGTYRGYALPEGAKPEYSIGVFAIFPLVRIEVIDPNGEYEEKVKRASSARVDVQSMEC